MTPQNKDVVFKKMNLEKIAKKGAFLIIIGDSIVGLRRDYESAIENAIDTYGNNGTVYGSPTYNSVCKYGGCYSFDGINDYIQIGNDDSFKSLTQGTIAGWVKSDLLKSNYFFTVGPKTTSSNGLFLWDEG